MALSANGTYDYSGGSAPTFSAIIKNASVVYNQALLSNDSTTGEAKPFDGTQGDRRLGWHFGDSVTGNSAAPRNLAQVNPGGFIFWSLAVTALSNNATDYGRPVYATDDGTYTTTDPGSGVIIGYVLPSDKIRASGRAHVLTRNIFGLVS